MAKIDEIKSEIEWLKDLFKILVMILVALVAGISKLYLDNLTNILFYSGITLGFGLAIWMIILAKHIKKNIKELGAL